MDAFATVKVCDDVTREHRLLRVPVQLSTCTVRKVVKAALHRLAVLLDSQLDDETRASIQVSQVYVMDSNHSGACVDLFMHDMLSFVVNVKKEVICINVSSRSGFLKPSPASAMISSSTLAQVTSGQGLLTTPTSGADCRNAASHLMITPESAEAAPPTPVLPSAAKPFSSPMGEANSHHPASAESSSSSLAAATVSMTDTAPVQQQQPVALHFEEVSDESEEDSNVGIHKATSSTLGWGAKAEESFDPLTYCDDPRKARIPRHLLNSPVRARRRVELRFERE